MAREEDAKDHYAGAYGHPVNGASLPTPHNHPPPEDEEFDEDEEEEEEYDSQDEDYEEEEVYYKPALDVPLADILYRTQ